MGKGRGKGKGKGRETEGRGKGKEGEGEAGGTCSKVLGGIDALVCNSRATGES